MKTIEIRLDSLAYGGDAVGRAEGRVVFVPFGAPGDLVEVALTGERRRFTNGTIQELKEASSQRVQAPCPHFGVCGGCNWQHLNYDAQLRAKRTLVIDALQRIGKLANVEVCDTIPSPQPLRYRNRGEFVFGLRRGRPAAGFFAAHSHEVVDIGECLIQSPLNQSIFASARRMIADGQLSVFNPRTGHGALRWLETRANADQSQALITLVTTTTKRLDVPRLVNAFRRATPQLTGLLRRVARSPRSDDTTAFADELLWGERFVVDRIAGIELRSSASSFSQANSSLAPTLIRLVVEFASLYGDERVADLYAGNGVFACALAAKCASVQAVERSEEACDDALWNFAKHQLTNCSIEAGKVEEIVARWRDRSETINVIVLDPPRRGAADTIAAIAGLNPARIVYVSCDPNTLARDLASLARLGYRTEVAQPLDLFPQTYHVEVVARIVKM